jgi:hypothetical protein
MSAESNKAHITRVADEHISSLTLEIVSPNLSDTYISCPPRPDRTLGIKLPYLVLLVKNLNRYFSFEVEVLDDKGTKRRFRASNFQVSGLRITSTCCHSNLSVDTRAPPA